jgi:Omptin family
MLLSICMRVVAAFTTSMLSAAPVSAADWTYRPFDLPAAATYTADFGLRFWYGSSKTSKNLYDPSGGMMVSRLTYSGMSIYAAEAYGRFDFDRRWFLKGYVGGGSFRNGNLKDEDFPPLTAPYSATLSVQQNGSPIYASLDFGYNVIRGPDFRVGVFGGFHYLNETVSAFGCTQISFNPDICGSTPIPNQVKVITQDNNWYSVRLGVDATVEFDRWRFSVDAAVVPYAWMYGSDAHWLRISDQPGDFSGPIPEDGTGWGYQLEGFVSYRMTEALSVGLGGRYWYMQSRGSTHFENRVNGFTAFPQPVEWKVQNFGVFAQMSLRLGPYNVIDVH